MQIILSIIIVLGAVGYAAWRLYNNLRDGGDPCKDCELRKNCQKNSQNTCENTCHCK